MTRQEACTKEIVDLHQFFQDWLDGSLPNRDDVFDRFAAVTAPTFTLIGPEGSMAGAEQTAQWIRTAHGTRPGFHLWTTDHTIHFQNDTLVVATYREWQTQADHANGRLSTAIFLVDAAAPNGLVWLHVHETWLRDAQG